MKTIMNAITRQLNEPRHGMTHESSLQQAVPNAELHHDARC